MNIIEALAAMREGHTVRHSSWREDATLRRDNESGLFEHSSRDGQTESDLVVRIARELVIEGGWSIVREQFDFAEAVRRMHAGKRVKRAAWVVPVIGESRISCLAVADVTATDWEEV
jgi:hypothetical protein